MIRMSINTEVRPADAEGIARAAELLRQGELVALRWEDLDVEQRTISVSKQCRINKCC